MVGEYGAVNAGYQSFQDVHQDIQSETKYQFGKFMTIFDKFTTIFGNIKPTLFGSLLCIISGLLFTTNSFIIKNSPVVISEVVLIRFIIQLSVCCIIICWKGHILLPENISTRILAVSQGLVGAVSLITGLASLSYMPVPDAICIILSCPFLTLLFSAIAKGERLKCLYWFSMTVSMIGLLLVIQPLEDSWSHDRRYYLGCALAGTATLTGSLMHVLISKSEHVANTVHLTWTAICGLVISVVFSQVDHQSRLFSIDITSITLSDWIILLVLALSGVVAVLCLNCALYLTSPKTVSSLRSLELIQAYVVQVVLMGVDPDALSCSGMLMVMCGVVVLACQEEIMKLFRVREVFPPYYADQPPRFRHQRMSENTILLGWS